MNKYHREEHVELQESRFVHTSTGQYGVTNATFQGDYSKQSAFPAPVPAGYESAFGSNPNAYPTAPPYTPAPAPMAITNQPGGVTGPYSPQPGGAPGPYPPQPAVYGSQNTSPRGLEYIGYLDQVFIKQKVELFEAISGFETNNKYRIIDPQGRQIFYAKEDTDCCTRQCCGNIRPFDIKLQDENKQEIIHLTRPLACGSCCFPCCLQSVEVQSPPGNVIGSVKQNWSIWIPKYTVKDEHGRSVYYIEGPCCTCSCFCGDVDFKIYDANDHSKQLGRISKKWPGLAKEYFTDAENFGVTFPAGADSKLKAVLIGATMLIDFMYFERSD